MNGWTKIDSKKEAKSVSLNYYEKKRKTIGKYALKYQ